MTGAESLHALRLAARTYRISAAIQTSPFDARGYVPPQRISCSGSNLRSDSGKQTRTVMATPREDVHGMGPEL
jgi:hypothetical protein